MYGVQRAAEAQRLGSFSSAYTISVTHFGFKRIMQLNHHERRAQHYLQMHDLRRVGEMCPMTLGGGAGVMCF